MLLIRPLNEFYHIIFLKIMQSYYVSQLKLYNSSPYTYQEVYAIVKFLFSHIWVFALHLKLFYYFMLTFIFNLIMGL